MELRNTTEIPATLLKTAVAEDAMLGALIARPSFEVKGRELLPSSRAAREVGLALQETSYGSFPGDVPYLSGGIDVFVMGSAHAPGPEPVRRLRVELRVGSRFQRALDVIGDRRWTRTRRGLVASEPEPFREMPLTWERAYGGTLQVEEGEYRFPHNARGRGVYFSEEQAQDGPLPNLEDPEHPIASFEDRPDPLCFAPCPIDSTLKALHAVELAGEGEGTELRRLLPTCFNQAHPQLVIPAPDGPAVGDEVVVTNVRPAGEGGDLRFAIPEVVLHAHVQLESRSYVFPLHLDQIGILCEERKVFLSYRCVFRYRVVKRERRRATLHAGPLPASLPAGYATDWSDEEAW